MFYKEKKRGFEVVYKGSLLELKVLYPRFKTYTIEVKKENKDLIKNFLKRLTLYNTAKLIEEKKFNKKTKFEELTTCPSCDSVMLKLKRDMYECTNPYCGYFEYRY